MTIFRTIPIILLSVLIAVSVPAYSEVGELPDTTETGAYVSEINTDWVKLSINTGGITENKLEGIEEKIFSTNEIWNLAEFSCNLYNRTSVLLSQSYESKGFFIHRIDYLFACAIQ